MKKIFFAAMLFFVAAKTTKSQSPELKPSILYGVIHKEDLLKDTYAEWFKPGYEKYQPDQKVLGQIKKTPVKNITIQVFLGTWCGDSRREVPGLLKVLDELSFPLKNFQMVGVGSSDSLLKQSPQHEEEGKGIFRVPTIIIYDGNREIGRINEFPCLSLEDDLLAILTRQPYTPNYKSFALVRKWMSDGTLVNKNVSARSLASQLRSLPEGDHELNGLARLLLKQGKKEEALKLFLVNFNLYPESIRAMASLGEGYCKMGDNTSAVNTLERALELNKDPKMTREILAALYEAKGIK